MLVSWKWLGQWTDLSGVDPEAFAQRFTCTVAEIDAVHRWGFGLGEVLVADVVAVAPHPAADKLRLATVHLGDRTETVVCGAPDLAVGLRVPFVPPGVKLPSGIEVKDGEVRGVRSPGMLASEKDLGLSDDNDGLLHLTGVTAPAGTPLPAAITLEDVLYEVDNKSITHRPDLWGQYGVAREVAAMLGRPLQPLDTEVALGSGDPLPVLVDDPAACLRYVCARVQGVQVGPSPVDARLLLRRLGVRPISNAVDATNLVMLETGNPLHAFDARQIRGNQIRVRKAQPGEQMQTLDGQLRTLTPADLLICDGEGPVAVAGVMGGLDSEIKDDTSEVVLEAAAFESAGIRKTAMRLGMRTESSARFEKALDPALAEVAARRFLRCLVQWSPGAQVTSGLLDAGPFRSQPPQPVVIQTSTRYLRDRLGVSATEMPDAWIATCLEQLGFLVAVGAGDVQSLHVQVPSWRATKDIRQPEDLVEELGRHYGYGNIRSQAPLIPSRPPYLPPDKRLASHLRQVLSLGQGLTEVQLYAFDHESSRKRLGLDEGSLPRLEVKNEIAADHKYLRRSLIPNLLACIEGNLLRGDGVTPAAKGLVVAHYELGRVFLPVAAHAVGPDDDSGLPPLAHLPESDPRRAAWFALLGAEVREAIAQRLAQPLCLPRQPRRLGIAIGERLGGGAQGSKWSMPDKALSERLLAEVLDVVTAVVRDARRGEVQFAPQAPELPGTADGLAVVDPAASWLHPVRQRWLVGAGGAVLGVAGTLHANVRRHLDVPAEIAFAELDLDVLLTLPVVEPRAAR